MLTYLGCILPMSIAADKPEKGAIKGGSSSLWSHENLFAWCVVPFDGKNRGPEERAQMLKRLGFMQFAYDWRYKDIPTFDAEIDALQEHGIHLLAWWFPLDADNPTATATLNLFKRHDVHPQLWVDLNSIDMPGSETVPKTPEGQEQRIKRDADRIKAIVQLAAPYGSSVALYNDDGWIGIEENQLAVIDRLKATGVNGVGMVYNFSHAHDDLHDDTGNFPPLWKRIKPYVVAVDISGIGPQGEELYPSQGDRELEMMRTIQQSGWRGPVALIAEKGGDAEITLRDYRTGLDWLAAELKQPGSGGHRPFPPVH
jgi:sugar phosphate isomerase/epimerase